MKSIFEEIKKNPDTKIEVDLEGQTITVLSSQQSESFEINSYKKTCLINGYDDIDFLVSMKEEVEAFEKARVE